MYNKILITGGNGLLGTNVIKSLEARGIAVRALLRRSNETLEHARNCKVILGNVLQHDDMRRAAEGCDAIIHICAITDQSLLRYEEYRRFNVGSLQVAIETAKACGIKRLIFVSTVNTIGNGNGSTPGDEQTPLQGVYARQLYARSKVEAEALLLSTPEIEGTIVNPCFMIGAYDSKPSSGELILLGYGKRVVFTAPGSKNIVDVHAAAEAICNALEHGRRGERYLLGGENVKLTDFYHMMSEIDGVKKCVIALPRWLMVGVGYVGDMLRCCGIRTQASSLNTRAICMTEHYSAAKAELELRLPKTDVAQCTRTAIDWFLANTSLLKRKA